MGIFNRARPNEKVKTKVLNRLRNTSTDEVVRWTDNINTAIGLNISEMRKNLTRKPDQALMYLDDIRTGAVSLLAAVQALEERINSAR